MIAPEVEHFPPRQALCSTVRITPYDGARKPQHDQARTFRFELPLTFAYVLRYQWNDGAGWTRPVPPFSALTAAEGGDLYHPDLRTIRAVTAALDGPDVHAVEVWSTDGRVHGLMPHWRPIVPDDWPCEDERGHVRLATGALHPAYAADDWPIPGGTVELGSGTFLHWQLSTDGPPPL